MLKCWEPGFHLQICDAHQNWCYARLRFSIQPEKVELSNRVQVGECLDTWLCNFFFLQNDLCVNRPDYFEKLFHLYDS